MGVNADEFPLLAAYGLYVSDTIGNGNCLFNALSDQLYGDQSRHHEIRASTIAYMREHANFYQQFVEVHPGGGTRRNPKRKNAGAYSTPISFVIPTAQEIERVFESHLQQMARGGTYGDNMEIVAFCSAFKVDVKIYQRDFAYLVPVTHEEPAERVVHIAYHTWEHYSSIRNIEGPHKGLPEVKETPLSKEAHEENQKKLANSSAVMPWMINSVISSLRDQAPDRTTIQKLLEKHKGSVDLAVSEILDAECSSSQSSAHGSSSVERDQDSDEESFSGPNKKQDRRLSRAARQKARGIEILPKKDLTLRPKDSPLSPISQQFIIKPDLPEVGTTRDSDETEEEDWQSTPPLATSHSPELSKGSRGNSAPNRPGPRLKINTARRKDEPTSNAVKLEDKSSSTDQSRGEGLNVKSRTQSPRRRIVSKNQRDMLKKAAQKAAAKDRRRAFAAARSGSTASSQIAFSKKGKENTPGLETSIKVLYI